MEKIREFFKWDDYQKLRLKVAFILLAVPTVVWSIVALFFHIVIKLNLYYLNAFSPQEVLEVSQKIELFFEEKSAFYLMIFAGHLVLNLFCGLHIAARLVRPFRRMAEFCKLAQKNPGVIYEPDFFSDFKFLTSFTDYFFSHLQQSRQKKIWSAQTIPPHYSRVRGPVFERSYFLSLFIVFALMTILAVTFLYFWSIDLNGELMNIALATLKKSESMEVHLFREQALLLNNIINFSAVLLFLTYSVLVSYFYQIAAGAAFAFFSTFRSYIKGQTHSRVHLIGHSFLRDYGREVNQYLKVVSRELSPSAKMDDGDVEESPDPSVPDKVA